LLREVEGAVVVVVREPLPRFIEGMLERCEEEGVCSVPLSIER